ncbi:TIGR04438 family Trp-rich protein [Polaromonas sp.]|uniref:TIGR04438 family Trp-rich protein n=1 Tax=Polaromonas sp. TaxID=1869339 RepID=UPI0013B78A91|nr:TIGR04438 family Trp-rich protein [Polaromonas sp.]NDP64886.1 TIGR04438 family Trp-rich protein [Polaromonas sp.]
MYFLGLGLALLIMKYLAVGPVADWSWWIILAPFGLAVLWWAWADNSGYTKKKAMERENDRRQDRIDRNRENMGTSTKKNRR